MPADGDPDGDADLDGDDDADGEDDSGGGANADAAGDDARLQEVVRATGHENVTAEHASTFEVTTDDWLTPAGDCILAVDADRSPADFASAFREAASDAEATIRFTIVAGDHEQTITGRGHPDLEMSNDTSMVGRTSIYVDDRTFVVDADAAAGDVDRDLVAALRDGADVRVVVEVEP